MVEKWKAYSTETGEEVQPEQVVTDFHGGKARFRRVLRGPSADRPPLVEVFCPNEGCPSERQAWVFGLKVVAS